MVMSKADSKNCKRGQTHECSDRRYAERPRHGDAHHLPHDVIGPNVEEGRRGSGDDSGGQGREHHGGPKAAAARHRAHERDRGKGGEGGIYRDPGVLGPNRGDDTDRQRHEHGDARVEENGCHEPECHRRQDVPARLGLEDDCRLDGTSGKDDQDADQQQSSAASPRTRHGTAIDTGREARRAQRERRADHRPPPPEMRRTSWQLSRRSGAE